MGLSSSQGRLLSITARLTSNEYESQQISNAKMRLATQSQEASKEYIEALNAKKLQYTTYDAKGDAIVQNLTAGALYQYSDLKNQYLLTNISGQVLLMQETATKFKNSKNLDEFLESYGFKKQWKSGSLESNYNKLQSEEYKTYKKNWEDKVQQAKLATYTYTDEDGNEKELSSDRMWEIEKSSANERYMTALSEYREAKNMQMSGNSVDNMQAIIDEVNAAKNEYSACITYQSWLNSQAMYETTTDENGNTHTQITEEYKNMEKYNEVLAEFNAEAEDFGPKLDDLYLYEDTANVQWYKNLWYRLNGSSTEKNPDADSKYTILDSKLVNSNTWLQDALTQGFITMEIAANEDIPDMIVSENPTIYDMKGISWSPIIYTTCAEVTQADDDITIAKAEAEYERKTKEISAKDDKLERKMKLLDTEHNSLQTEYESVQSAMNKNIERSFKAFS